MLAGVFARSALFLVTAFPLVAQQPGETRPAAAGSVALPPLQTVGGMPLVQAIFQRQSVRRFLDRQLEPEQIGQLCWAAQGITDPGRGRRTAPSAGALYPLELYVVSASGVEHYLPAQHALERHLTGDLRRKLSQSALSQESVADSPVCFVIAAVVERSAVKYGERAERYCFLEAGHVAQNILLQATALGLDGVPVGAFEDHQVAAVLKLPAGQRVLYLVPVGYAAP